MLSSIDIILNDNPVPIRDRAPGLAEGLAAAIDKALDRISKQRFQNAIEIHQGMSS